VALAFAGALCAQTSQATLQGIVQDASARRADARVIVTNVAPVKIEKSKPAQTPLRSSILFPGDYNLRVEHAGFRRYAQTGIKLDVQQT